MKIYAVMSVLLGLLIGLQVVRAGAGVDFYQFWSVSKAQTLSAHRLGSPYEERTRYAAVLAAYAAQSSDPFQKAANRFYPYTLDLAETPLLYFVFGCLPKNYTAAFFVYRVMLTLAFIASIVILGAITSGRSGELLALAALLAAMWAPFRSDVTVGNCNSIQLLFVVLLVVFAERQLGRRFRAPLLACAVFACGLVLFTLFKPNLSMIALFLAAHMWAACGTLVFAQAVTASALFALAVGAVTSIKFGSWLVWFEWYQYLSHRFGPAALASLVTQGNYSTVVVLSRALRISIFAATVGVASAMFVSLAITMLMSLPEGEGGVRRASQAVIRAVHDPFLCAACGAIGTLALTPLGWAHYYVLSIFPVVWLLSSRQSWRYSGPAGGTSLVLSSNLATPFLQMLWKSGGLVPYVVGLSWVPLWVGFLAAVASAATPVAGQRV